MTASLLLVHGAWHGSWCWGPLRDALGDDVRVHTVDLLRWYLGRPEEIFAHTAQLAHERVEVEDTATATVRFASGALAVAAAAGGGAYVVWTSERGVELWRRGSETESIAPGGKIPTIVTAGDGALAAWEEGGGVRVARVR